MIHILEEDLVRHNVSTVKNEEVKENNDFELI